MKTGQVTKKEDSRRFIPIHAIANTLSPIACKLLPSLHCLTGCDTTPALFKKGKVTAFKKMLVDLSKYENLVSIGGDDIELAVRAARELIADLYDTRGKFKSCHHDLNELRCKLAFRSVTIAKLPPCEDSFREFIKRVMWQARIWMSSHIAMPSLGSPSQYGYTDDLDPVLYTGYTSSEILDKLICDCKGKKMCSKSCSCKDQGLSCTDVCFCGGEDDCKNDLSNAEDVSSESTADGVEAEGQVDTFDD